MTTINDMSNPMHTQHNQDGITLLVTLILMGVLMGISASLLNVTLKQFQLSGIAYSSEVAFQAANAGMECALFHDLPRDGGEGLFMVPGDGTEQTDVVSMNCMGAGFVQSSDGSNSTYTDPTPGNNKAVSGGEQRFRFTWGSNPRVCSEVSVYKFYSESGSLDLEVNGVDMRPTSPDSAGDCPVGSVCTVVQSRGYNVACNDITSGRVVEREYTQVY